MLSEYRFSGSERDRRHARTHPRGVTMVELVVMLSVIGVLVVLTTPTLGRSWDAEQVRAAKVTFTGLHAKARAVAVQRSSQTVLRVNGGNMLIQSVDPVTGLVDTVGSIVNFYDQFGVYVRASRDSVRFDARGIGTEPSSSYFVFARNARVDTVRVSRTGRFYP